MRKIKLPFVVVGLLIVLVLSAVLLTFLRRSPSPPATELFSTPIPITSPQSLAPAQLLVIAGTVDLSKNSGAHQVIGKNSSTTLTMSDTVVTGVGSLASIDYGNGTVVRLAPQTQLTYFEQNKKLTIKQLLGNAYVRFTKIIGVRENIEIETPSTLASVRGTKFGVFIKNGKSKFAVTEHQISVSKKDPGGVAMVNTQVIVDAGKQVENASNSGQLAVQNQQFTTDEQVWMQFNAAADELGNFTDANQLATLSAQLMKIAASPSPAPSPIPGVSASPKPSTAPITYSTQMPGEGYQSVMVKTISGDFSLSCFGKNKNSIRVITDSASETDCKNDCPVKPLAEYASSNGGIAAMNGMYFCPPDYPACSDKKNSFDTLFFNSRVKRYINSDNNIYSTIPFLVVDGGSNPRFVAHAQEWGRDTGISAGTAGNPLLVQSGNYAVDNYPLDDKQRNVKSNRGAFVQKGDNLYLCIVKNATVPDSGQVYKALNADNAINIDGGGSSALWVNGSYKFGPGRNIPTAIIFANR